MKKLLVWMLLAAILLTGCGTKKSPSTAEPAPPAPPEPVTQESQQTVKLLPKAFPMTLHFSSGAGGWQTELTLQRDGAFAGQFHDSDMGSIGEDYPRGTVYLCEFEGQFGDFQTVDDTTLSLTLEELTALTAEEDVWYEEGVRMIGATPYGLEGGTEFLLYLPDTPAALLTDRARSGWPLAGTETETLDCYVLHNTAADTAFFDWSYWFPEDESAEAPLPEKAEP